MLDKPVYEVIIPTVNGEIAVFPDHESLVTTVKQGVIAVRYEKNDADENMDYFAITGGVAQIDSDTVKVLVDEADSGADILESESKAALDRAKQLRDNAKDQVELEKAHQLIDRHAVRLKVADLQRRKRRKP